MTRLYAMLIACSMICSPVLRADEDHPETTSPRPTIIGERLNRSLYGESLVEDYSAVLERQKQRDEQAQQAPNDKRGAWMVPSRTAADHSHSGTRYLINRWGDPSMGIGFGRSVRVDGVFVAGQSSQGVWAAAIRVVGYRNDQEVARTEWFDQLSDESTWCVINLDNVDPVVFQAIPAAEMAGWYAIDDLTYTPISNDNSPASQVVLDFEDLAYRQILTDSGYAGLNWESGTGDLVSGWIIHAPRRMDIPGEDTMVVDPSLALRGGGGTEPTLIDSFQGVIRGDAGQFSVPPDTHGAIGPDHFVEIVNRNFAVYNKTTGAEIQNVSIDTFMPGASGDPRIVFDPHSDRWIVIITDFDDTIFLGISMTDDPTGAWFKTNFNISQESDSGCWPDFPTLGVDAKGIYTSAFMVGCGMSAFAIDKAPLLTATPALGDIFAFRGLPFEGAIQPAVTYGQPSGEFFVSVASSSSLRVRRFTGFAPLPTAQLTDLGLVSVSAHSFPPDAPAMGSNVNLDSGDTRISNVVYRNGSLWAAHTIGVNGRAACRWYQISAASLNVLQEGTISDASLSFFYPSIAVNVADDAIMGFSGSNAGQFAACYYTGRSGNDPPGEMATPVLLRQGDGAYEQIDQFGRNRWGDYSYSSVDPSDDRGFWTVQEYAHANDIWGTQIASFAFDDCNGNDVVDATDILAGTSDDCNVNEVPDECEFGLAIFSDSSPQLSPIGDGSPQSHTLTMPPVANGTVTLNFSASADLSATNEFFDVDINGTPVGTVFDSGANDCPQAANLDSFTIDPTTYNNIVNGGNATITMTATSPVNPDLCNPPSFVSVTTQYDITGGPNDCNGNNELDSCEAAELILEQPVNVGGCVGETVQLNMTPTQPGLTFQWKKDGIPLTDGPDVSGAATQAVTISNLQVGQTGLYVCEFSEGCVTGETDPASLSIIEPAFVQSDPTPTLTRCGGDNASFSVDGGGTGPFDYQWLKDGQDFGAPNSAILTLNSVSVDDAGDYTCIISNSCGFEESAAGVLEIGDPVFFEHPQSQCVTSGGTAVFTADATAGGAFTIFWKKDGEFISGSGTTLTVNDVEPSDAGDYTAVAFLSSTPFCTSESDAGTLTVDACGLPDCANTDVDCSGTTNAVDIGVVRAIANFNTAVCDPIVANRTSQPRADVDRNGNVNAVDIGVIRAIANFNTSTGPCTCVTTHPNWPCIP